MTIHIAQQDWEGPLLSLHAINEAPGVFVVLTCASRRLDAAETTWRVIDADESEDVRAAVLHSPRLPVWKAANEGLLGVAVRFFTHEDGAEVRRHLLAETRRALRMTP